MMLRGSLLVVCLVTLVGCGSNPADFQAVMYNPDTKDTARCNTNVHAYDHKEVLAHCVKGYEAAGYRRVDPVK